MSSSPIEFLGEEPGHDVPATEYGGADGLIQPEQPGVVLSGDPAASGGHMLSGAGGSSGSAVSEKARIMARAASAPLSLAEGRSGVPLEPGVVRDWATDRLLPGDASVAIDPADPAGSGGLSGLQDGLGGTAVEG